MKRIELLKVEIDLKEINGEDKKMDFPYKQVLKKLCSTSGREKGFGVSDIEKRLKIRAQLNKSEDFVLLEDSEHKYLENLVKNEKWSFPAQEILDFVKAVKEAVSVEAKSE